MIFHSANNLRKRKRKKKKRKEKRKKKEKEKEKRKKRKKRKKEKEKERKKKKGKEKKRGHKGIETKAPCNNSNLAIPFKHGQVIFKFNVDRLVNKSDQTV